MAHAMAGLAGICLCGACAFTATPRKAEAGACHCGMCRKWSGGMFIATECADVTFTTDAPLGRYRSSEWGERVFCRECGSTLMWQSRDGSMQVVSVQAFEEPGQFTLTSQIFIDSKPDSYALANETHMMTGAEVIAAFAPDAQPGGAQ